MQRNCEICGKKLNNWYAVRCGKHRIFSAEYRKAISQGKIKENPGYRAIHLWITKQLGKPTKCEHCKKTFSGHKIHWANISKLYKRELTDWIRLCAKCHKAFDTGKTQSRKVKI